MKTTRIKMTPSRKKSAKNQKQPPEKIIKTIRKNIICLLFCIVLVFLGVLYRLASGYDIFQDPQCV